MTDADLANELSVGMQLNLWDCTCEGQHITPDLIIIEPDFLLDISAVAACFQNYGHHPITYLLNQLKPRANSQPILLGNFAGTALDDLINREDLKAILGHVLLDFQQKNRCTVLHERGQCCFHITVI